MSVIVTLGALVASNVVLLMSVFKFATCAYYINKRKALYKFSWLLLLLLPQLYHAYLYSR